MSLLHKTKITFKKIFFRKEEGKELIRKRLNGALRNLGYTSECVCQHRADVRLSVV